MSRKRKVLKGTVVSDEMDKTITVKIKRWYQHSLYKKRLRKKSKIKVHDEDNTCSSGDKVEVIESKPISKEKRFRVYRNLSKQVAEGTNDDTGDE